MAEIVGSLFGVTPELYQEQRDQMARQRAMQLARMAPLEQASYGAARAGQQLGGAFASDVHGKNHFREGSFSNHVISIEILLK